LIISNDARTADAIRRGLHATPAREVACFVNGRVRWGNPSRGWTPDVIVIREPGPLARRRRTAEAHRTWPGAKIVVLADTADREELARLVTADVDAVVSAVAGTHTVGVLIDAIAAGHVYNPVSAPAPRPDAVAAPEHGLTKREAQILELAASGLGNGQIAAQLGVCAPTVKFHLSNVYRKLGLANRTAAALYAQRRQLLATDHAPEPSGAPA
jgi:DNA-binding NarL/FixJ family response regulator